MAPRMDVFQWPSRNSLPALTLACCGIMAAALPIYGHAQAPIPPATQKPVPPPAGNAQEGDKSAPSGKNDNKDEAAARKAMREERDTLLKQRAEMDKRIRELDKKLLGEDFDDDAAPAPNAKGWTFVIPRSLFVPGAPNQNQLPPQWDKQMRQQMEEMNRALQQNFPKFQNFQPFQNFGNGFRFNGNNMFFGGLPGVNSFEFRYTNDPIHPFVFRLDGIDIDSPDFDKHLDNVKKTDPEREKQLRSAREQLREAEQKRQNGLRTLPRAPKSTTPKDKAAPAAPAPTRTYI